MQETQVQSLGRKYPLEKKRATHSTIPARTIPWTEEPDRLQSIGSQRVGHDRATEHTHKEKSLCRLPWWLNDKESACNAGDPGLIPDLGRAPGEGNNPLQYSCLESSMATGAWLAPDHGVTKRWT